MRTTEWKTREGDTKPALVAKLYDQTGVIDLANTTITLHLHAQSNSHPHTTWTASTTGTKGEITVNPDGLIPEGVYRVFAVVRWVDMTQVTVPNSDDDVAWLLRVAARP